MGIRITRKLLDYYHRLNRIMILPKDYEYDTPYKVCEIPIDGETYRAFMNEHHWCQHYLDMSMKVVTEDICIRKYVLLNVFPIVMANPLKIVCEDGTERIFYMSEDRKILVEMSAKVKETIEE